MTAIDSSFDLSIGLEQQLVPLPTADYNEGRSSATDDGTIQLYGHCAAFFTDDRTETSGLPVEGHGVWCESRSTVLVQGNNEQGTTTWISMQVVQPYLQGSYLAQQVRALGRDSEVRLRVFKYDVDEDQAVVHLSVGDARRMLAGLQVLVTAADHLEQDLTGETARRRADTMTA